ncbi:MAG: hypothetical protein HY905_19605 [Deltaproteobacteria bacterium]|nr:hypothetical protein [Deltaproteobacteria bacterium]
MKLLTVVVALGMLMGAVPAAADDPEEGVPYANYTFGDELVESSLYRPDLDALYARGHRPTISLIKIRQNFINEMFKSGENL